MTIHYDADGITIHAGDCLDVLRNLPDASVDAIVTDPPYGLEFMGKEWDKFDRKGPASFENLGPRPTENRPWRGDQGSSSSTAYIDKPRFSTMGPKAMLAFGDWCEAWATECLRVLKPGGHLLAFGGTRTWHRLTCAIEDAGFEIRDSIAWLYGSGFPKSLDVSKAIDKLDAADERLSRARRFQSWLREHVTPQQVDEATGTNMGYHYTTHPTQPSVATVAHLNMLRPLLPNVPEWVEQMCQQRTVESETFAKRPPAEYAGRPGMAESWTEGTGWNGRSSRGGEGVTDDAQTWQGWGTALKPAHEPIVVARKPLAGTVAANVLTHGTGALNIDACRIEGDVPSVPQPDFKRVHGERTRLDAYARNGEMSAAPGGRWPANVVLDDNQATALDTMSGESRDGVAVRHRGVNAGMYGPDLAEGSADLGYGGEGGASRFFYTAKADATERIRLPKPGAGEGRVTGLGGKIRQCNICETKAIASGANELSCGHNDHRWVDNPRPEVVAHPTVKPLSLMRWLVRLVTPPGGTVLEPFAGSGTTVEACILENFNCVAIEREPDYLPLILQRIHRRRDPVQAIRATGDDGGLFDLLDCEDES